jgi:hypothetical protein
MKSQSIELGRGTLVGRTALEVTRITAVCWRMNRCRVRCSIKQLCCSTSSSRRTACLPELPLRRLPRHRQNRSSVVSLFDRSKNSADVDASLAVAVRKAGAMRTATTSNSPNGGNSVRRYHLLRPTVAAGSAARRCRSRSLSRQRWRGRACRDSCSGRAGSRGSPCHM